MTYLTGKNVKLVRFTEEHITEKYIGWLNCQDVTKYLDTGRLLVAKKDISIPDGVNNMLFAIMYGENNVYVGTASLHKVDWISRRGKIGYMIGDTEFWGKGIITETIGMLCDYAFGRLNLNKITAGVVDGNIGSEVALKKNGFRVFATNPSDYYLDGKYMDTKMFCKFKNSGEAI